VRVLANRGANGIDGFVSSVLGAAAAAPGPTVGLCGDLSFYHDLNGLLAAKRHGVRAVFVVLDNDGGGIFDHLPVARHPEHYEELFVTPHGLDFRHAAEMYGAAFARVTEPAALAPAVAAALDAPGTAIVALRIDRGLSLAAHARAWARAAAALGKPA
jgi:2-succinyl-5-enolpyruvyl-6-hydroxy-3-cyclohexene-1-carboxylate synthase